MDTKQDLAILVGKKIFFLGISRFGGGWFNLEENDSKIRISFDGELYFTNAKGKEICIEDMQTQGGLLCSLLGLTIEEVQPIKTGPEYAASQLILTMTGGVRLQIICCPFVDVDGKQIFPSHKEYLKLNRKNNT